MERRALIGIAAGSALALAAGGWLVLRPTEPDDTFDLGKDQPFLTGSPSPSSIPPLVDWGSLVSKSPQAGTPSATPSPVSSPTTVPTATRAPGSSTPAAAPAPQPAPPAPQALPAGCNALPDPCAYQGTKYSVTSGVSSLRCDSTGPDSLKISWTSDNLATRGTMPGVAEFVVRLWKYPAGDDDAQIKDPAQLFQVRVGAKNRHVYVSKLSRGAHYACFVQELNAGGLSPAGRVLDVRTAPGTPAPSNSPSPSETPTATSSPTPTPTPTPSPSTTP